MPSRLENAARLKSLYVPVHGRQLRGLKIILRYDNRATRVGFCYSISLRLQQLAFKRETAH